MRLAVRSRRLDCRRCTGIHGLAGGREHRLGLLSLRGLAAHAKQIAGESADTAANQCPQTGIPGQSADRGPAGGTAGQDPLLGLAQIPTRGGAEQEQARGGKADG